MQAQLKATSLQAGNKRMGTHKPLIRSTDFPSTKNQAGFIEFHGGEASAASLPDETGARFSVRLGA